MTDKLEWRGRVGKSWAEEWARTDRSFRQLTRHLLARLQECEFQNVLDIGCGAGELSIALADAAPQARICGLDISPDLVEVARSRSKGRTNLAFEIGDASEWNSGGSDGEPSQKFDLFASRHGVMFFDDPVAGFSNIARLAEPAAHLVFSCFRGPSENPFFSEVARLLPAGSVPAEPLAPGPFAFADDGRVRRILSEAGWSAIGFEAFDFQMVAGTGNDPVADALAYFSKIGPAARAMEGMDEETRAQTSRAILQLASDHLCDGKVALKAAAWIVSASKG